MKKIILLLLLIFTSLSYGQTTLANKLKINANTTSTTATKVNVQESDGTVNTKPLSDFMQLPDIAGKENQFNKQNSLATDGSGVKYPTVDAINKVVQFVTPEQFGAVGDGVANDAVPFQNFLNSPLSKSISSNKTYKIETELIITVPCKLNFNNSTLTSNTLLRLLTLKSSDVSISNGNFISNMTGDYTVIAETEPYANSWLIGCKLIDGESFSNISISDCYFSTPNGSLNAVKLISHRSGFGGELKHISVKNNKFKDIGRMAVEVLGEGLTQWYSHLSISNNYFYNLGNWSEYGMAVSLSGLGTENVISENIIELAKDLCIENAGANNTYILNNTSKNPKIGVTPMAINSGDSGVRGFGNISLNNTFEGTYARGIQIIFQNNYFSQNNRVEKAENLALINEVSDSKFIADYFNSTLNASVVLQNTSSNNIFDNCTFSVFETLVFTDNIACQTSSSNNYFSNSQFINSTFGGVSLTQSGGATNNLIEKYIIKDNITTLSGYGITDAVTVSTTQTITGTKTASLKWNFLDTWANSQMSLGQVGQGGLMRFIGTGGTGTLGYLGATSSALQLYSPNVLTLNSANYIDFQFNGTQKIKLFGSSGNVVIQNGGTFTDDTINRLQVTGTVSSGSTTLGNTPPTANNQLTRKDYVDLKAPIASPTFTGNPTAPTPTLGDNDTSVATTAFVQSTTNSNAVLLTGDQTATGRKTFTSDNTTVGGINIINTRNITTGGTSDQAGLYISNTNTAQGLLIDNSSSGSGIQLSNVGVGAGTHISNFSTGTALSLRTQPGATGDLLNAELGATRIQSTGKLSTTLTPTVGNDVTNKTYVDNTIKAQTGWANYSTTTYTSASPFSISPASTVTLPNNANNSIITDLPLGITAFYDGATNKITPASIGDAYIVNVRFKAKTTTNNDYLTLYIDIGAGTQINAEARQFLKGANTEQAFSFTLPIYTLATFVANGGLVKITSNAGTISVYDITYFITRNYTR